MEGRLSRSGRTAGRERRSYCSGIGIGAKEGSALDFSSSVQFSDSLPFEACYHHGKHEEALMMGMGSTSSDGYTTEDDSFSSDLHESLCKKVGGTAVTNVGDVLSVEQKRHSSPSVIARLMGLDELPQVVSASDYANGPFLFKKSYERTREKSELYGDRLFRVNIRERHKVKNVQDLFKSSKARKQSDQNFQQKTNTKPDLAFIRQQFMEAKHLSTDESLQDSKKLTNVFDILQSNKNIFIEFLENPNPLFAKHLHGLKLSKVSDHASNVASSRTSNGKLHEKNELFDGLVEDTRRGTQKHKDNALCCAQMSASLVNYNINDHMDSHLNKITRPRNAKKADASVHPNSVVVLKPNVQKAQSSIRTESFLRSLVNYPPTFRRRSEFHQEPNFEQGKKGKLFHLKTIGCKAEGTREIRSDVSVQIEQYSKFHSIEVQASKDDGNDSLTYLREPSLNMESRKHLSEPWKMSSTAAEGSAGEVLFTLAAMLSLSDTEPSESLDQFNFQNVPEEKAVKEGIPDSWSHPYGISSRDGSNEKFDSRVPRYGNVGTLSGIYGASKPANRHQVDFIKHNDDCYMLKDVLNLEQNDVLESKFKKKHSFVRNFKHCDNNQQFFRCFGEENKRPVRKDEMYQGDQRKRVNLNDLFEQKPLYSRSLKRNMDNIVNMVHSSSNPNGMYSNFLEMSNLKGCQKITKQEDLLDNFLENGVTEVQLASADSPSKEAPLDSSSGSVIPITPKDTERLSPVSVLEQPFEDVKSTPDCFESIRPDLQDLRRQLDLLQFEPFDYSDEKPKLLTAGNNATERDFSYVLDVLTISGICAADEGKLFDACCSPSNPVFPDIFDKLEKKYNLVAVWSRSERKLLFDHINSILSEVLAPCVDLHPWVKSKRIAACSHERLLHESWRILVLQRKELSIGKPEEKVLDTGWLFLDDHIDMIGREIERMLKDDLLDELVLEFILG